MSSIRGAYSEDPDFPATDQHPEAVRYRVNGTVCGDVIVDAVGGEPTVEEMNAFFAPPPAPTPADKLAASGLTVAELKELLGLP